LGVECNSFCSLVHLHYTTNHISLYFFCGASLLITVVWLMDLWSLDLLLPHSSNISLALVPSSSFPLLSFSCLLFVADCHVNFLTLLIDLSQTNSLIPFSSAL
jgi:hypothetical protein